MYTFFVLPCLALPLFLFVLGGGAILETGRNQLAALTLAELSVILLPIDAANGSGNVQCNESWSSLFCGSLDMAAAWHTVFLLVFILALFVVPYTIFFYEEDDSLALT